MHKNLLLACSAAMLVCSFCLGQDAVEKSEERSFAVSRHQNGIAISVGDYEIRNTYMLKKSKSSGAPMYRSFMHGVPDGKAMPVAWQSLGENLPLEKDGFKIALKSSELPSIMLKGGEKLELPKPVLNADTLASMKGQYLRLFIWIKGDGTGKNGDLWSGAPSVKVDIVDYDGELLSCVPASFRTRGSFPWFCYHLDVEVPPLNKPGDTAAQKGAAPSEAAAKAEDEENWDILLDEVVEKEIAPKRAGGLYVTLSNPSSGNAWFSTLSWQTIKESQLMTNADAMASRFDPATNSTAPNPDYDELPMHLIFGVSSDRPWLFLKGNANWKGIDTPDKLAEYLDGVSGDWMHMVHGVSQLVLLYNNGVLLKTMPTLNDEWKSLLLKRIPAMQDAATGMWLVNGKPSLFATHAIVFNCYAPKGFSHPGYLPRETSWLSLPEMRLVHADAMIKSIVAQQRRVGTRKTPAGWNNYAFMENIDELDDAELPCTLQATACAVELLARASQTTENPAMRKLAEQAIQSSWSYVQKELFMKSSSALWKMAADDKVPSVPGPMFKLIEATSWLDLRQNKELRFQPPATTLDAEGNFTLKWKHEKGYLSLRVFAAPADLQTSELKDEHLVAIIHPKSSSVMDNDPYLAMRIIAAEATKQWGITLESEDADYIAKKLAALPKQMKSFSKIGKVSMVIPQKKQSQAVHIAAVNAYGEMTQFITLPETIAASGAAESEEAATEADGGAAQDNVVVE